MKEKEDKSRYIVVRQPNDNNAYRNGLRIIHMVITYEELHKKIDDYLNNKIERVPDVYAPIDLFNYIVKHRKIYSFEEAKRRAYYLNRKYGRK